MTTKNKKTNSNLPAKEYSAKDAKDFILSRIKTPSDPQEHLTRFANDYLALVDKKGTPKEKNKEMLEKAGELAMALSLDTGFLLIQSVDTQHWGLAVQMRNDLQKEYACDRPSEKALIDIVVNSYIKKLSLSNKMGGNQKYLGSEHDGYRNYLSKEIDRAHRQFLSALETLRIIKQPPIKVNLKTENAYIAQNQQINRAKAESNDTQ